MHSLYTTSKELVADYNEFIKKPIEVNQESRVINTEIKVLNGDFLDYSWDDAKVIFTNSTGFSEELMEKISLKAKPLKEGTIFITTTKSLVGLSEEWEYVKEFRRRMPFGLSTIFIHYKKFKVKEVILDK